jgi:hypothetical protein
MTSILQVLAKGMKVFENLIAHIEHSQFLEHLAKSLKYFILIPFFDAILFSRPLHDIMSNGVIKILCLARDIADF